MIYRVTDTKPGVDRAVGGDKELDAQETEKEVKH